MKAYAPPGAGLPKAGDRLLDKFLVERLIGQGGAGVVYAARHELLDQPIALKCLLAEPGSEAANRFVNEAKLAARIQSEHVCRVMDVGTLPSGVPYIAMELLEGHDLDATLATGAVPLDQLCDYVLQAIDAIAQAHAQGIVHRDLKPSNLFVTTRAGGPPIIKVLDFGISKGDMLGTEQNVTSSRAILGSPSYMSPEQIKNARTVDARTDVWSLGVILFELACGRAPFLGETVGEVFAKILEADPPSLRQIAPQIPEAFEEAVRRCLARDREQRFANVGQLAEAIAPFASGAGPALVPRILDVLGGAPSSREPSQALARNVNAMSATAAPWTESSPAPRKRPGMLVVLPITFLLGGATVYYFAVMRANTPAPIAAGGAPVATITVPSLQDAAIPEDAAAPSANAATNVDLLDASVLDGALDRGDLDAGDGGDEEEEEDDDDDAGIEADAGHRAAQATARKPGTVKPGVKAPKTRKGTKKKSGKTTKR